MTTTAKGVTPEMVEVGAKACRDVTFKALTMDECRDAVRAALEAALSVSSGGLAVEALLDALEAAQVRLSLVGAWLQRNHGTQEVNGVSCEVGVDEITAALSALDRTTLPAAEGWRDIKTAPQDDKDILVGGWLENDRWHGQEDGWKGWHVTISSYVDQPYRRGFNHRNGANWARVWMPLPGEAVRPVEDSAAEDGAL